MRLSLIIPCYNEAGNLPALVQRLREIAVPDFEVVLVDNGSVDATSDLLSELIAETKFIRSVRVPINRGYGFGILSGLEVATGEILSWTHADLQTDPADAIRGAELFRSAPDPARIFVKGRRGRRALRDEMFTHSMSAFELLVLGVWLVDINAQPTMFHRNFRLTWSAPPHDFSLDLYAYAKAVRSGLEIRRFPVEFRPRGAGVGHNDTITAKIRYSQRTVSYSLNLACRLRREARS